MFDIYPLSTFIMRVLVIYAKNRPIVLPAIISDVTNVSSARIVANVYVRNTIGYNNGVILKEFATDMIVFYD